MVQLIYSQDVNYAIPNSVGMMQFPTIKPPANTLNAIINHINTNGITVYGSVIIAMRDGFNLSSDEQKLIFEALRADLHNLLEQTLAEDGIYSGDVILSNYQLRIKQVILDFFNSTGEITAKVFKGIFGVKENIVGVHVIALVDLPSTIVNPVLDILKSPINQYINSVFSNDYILSIDNFEVPVVNPSININFSPISYISNFNNFKICQIDIDGTVVAPGILVDGKFSVGATIGGSGNYSFYQTALKPIEFRLEKELNTNTKALYKVKGNINKNTLYTIDANHVNPAECIIPEDCESNKILNDFGVDQGWTDNNIYPRFFGDVNGDGYQDIIGFGNNKVFVSLNQSGIFFNTNLIQASSYYCVSQGFQNNDIHPRIVKDINNDGRVDIVGFGPNGIYRSLGKTDGTFSTPIFITNDMSINWVYPWQSNYLKPRYIEEMTGDNFPDIVGFNNNAVYVLKNIDGFNPNLISSPILWLSDFGLDHGWTNSNVNMRLVADMNNDGKCDLIGFKDQGVYISLTNSSGTAGLAKTLWTSNFAQNTGWTENEKYPRYIVDLNNDNFLDILGFGYYDVEVCINNKNNTFKPLEYWSSEFGKFDGYGDFQSDPKLVGDINGDNLPDIISIGAGNSLIALNNGTSFKIHKFEDIGDIKNYYPYVFTISGYPFPITINIPLSQNISPKYLINSDPSDNSLELISFSKDGTYILNCFKEISFRTKDVQISETNQLSNNNFANIFPNPTNGKFMVKLNNEVTSLHKINILDIYGNLIDSRIVDQDLISFDKMLPSGMYIIQIENENSLIISTDKIIIQ